MGDGEAVPLVLGGGDGAPGMLAGGGRGARGGAPREGRPRARLEA